MDVPRSPWPTTKVVLSSTAYVPPPGCVPYCLVPPGPDGYCAFHSPFKRMDADDAARVQRLREEGEVHFFDKIAAERLADEVAVLVCRGVIDARSPAGDALLDYRSPPPSDRSDRLVNLEAEVQSAERDIEALTAERDDALKLGRLVARALDDLCSHRAAHDWFERFGYTE